MRLETRSRGGVNESCLYITLASFFHRIQCKRIGDTTSLQDMCYRWSVLIKSTHYDRSDMVVKTIRDSNQHRNVTFFLLYVLITKSLVFEKKLRSVEICGKWRIFMKSIIS